MSSLQNSKRYPSATSIENPGETSGDIHKGVSEITPKWASWGTCEWLLAETLRGTFTINIWVISESTLWKLSGRIPNLVYNLSEQTLPQLPEKLLEDLPKKSKKIFRENSYRGTFRWISVGTPTGISGRNLWRNSGESSGTSDCENNSFRNFRIIFCGIFRRNYQWYSLICYRRNLCDNTQRNTDCNFRRNYNRNSRRNSYGNFRMNCYRNFWRNSYRKIRGTLTVSFWGIPSGTSEWTPTEILDGLPEFLPSWTFRVAPTGTSRGTFTGTSGGTRIGTFRWTPSGTSECTSTWTSGRIISDSPSYTSGETHTRTSRGTLTGSFGGNYYRNSRRNFYRNFRKNSYRNYQRNSYGNFQSNSN